MRDLESKRALVTGGTRGIGAAIAERLAHEGATVVVTGTKGGGTRFEMMCADFACATELEAFAERVRESGFDILVNNAGINKIGAFAEYDPSDFQKIQRVNLEAPFLFCRAVLPHMISKQWGRIVNIGSIFGQISKEFRAAYSASKFALDGMTVALAAEMAPHGILSNCVSPGFIDTDLTRSILKPSEIERLTASVPMKRLGRPEEVAELVAWLCSPRNTYLTGQNIAIDGGFSRV